MLESKTMQKKYWKNLKIFKTTNLEPRSLKVFSCNNSIIKYGHTTGHGWSSILIV